MASNESGEEPFTVPVKVVRKLLNLLNTHGLSMHIKTVSIFGLGYIGLPTAAILAEAGAKSSVLMLIPWR